MKYFIDTEFIEGWKKPIKWLPTIGNFNKPYHSIQLISIGIISEDNRTYYAISNEFNANDANDWVKKNVLNKLPERFKYIDNGALEASIDKIDTYTSNKQIAKEIKQFIYKPFNDLANSLQISEVYSNDIEFYGYYSDYDWVVFCSLFGSMIDLPEWFPKYCKDLKQDLDRIVIRTINKNGPNEKLHTFDSTLKFYKDKKDYPKQDNEHNALDDAKWNLKLYKFLTYAL